MADYTPGKSAKFESSKATEEERLLWRDYKEDLDAHDDNIDSVPFEALEAMESSKVYDDVSKETKNGVTDSMTATIYDERAARVVGQLPGGEVKAMGKRDKGKAMFMDLIRSKWIYPNANAQRPLKEKLYLWKNKASVYNWCPMYYDLDMKPSGYFGPDCWLWNPRNWVRQNGKFTVSDMDYCHALAFVSPSWFEDVLEDDQETEYDKKCIKELLDSIKNKTRNNDPHRDTKQNQETKNSVREVCVATRYEAGKKGRWVTFLPEFNCKIIRNIPNPHKNGRIPFVVLHGRPDAFSWQGTGDYQRSMPIQAVSDGATDFYFEAVRRNLAPATYVNAQSLISHTWSDEPNALIQFNGPPEVKQADTSTAGLSTYQAVKGEARGALQSIAGTTDTRSNTENSMDPGFAKTPEGLKQIAAREDTRDSQDRDFFEEACKELIDGWLSIIPTVPNKIPVDMFAGEIEDIRKAGGEDLDEMLIHGQPMMDENDEIMYDTEGNPMRHESKLVTSGLATFKEAESGNQVRIRINPAKLKGLEYRFELEPNSTAKKTKQEQLQGLMDYLTFLGKMPNALQQLQEKGKMLNWEKINEVYGALADIPGMDEMLTDAPPMPQETPDQPTQPTSQTTEPSTPQPPQEDLNVAGVEFKDPVIAQKARELLGGQNAPVAG